MHTPSFPYLNRCNVGEQEVREESRRGRGVIYRSADSCRRLEDEVCSEEGFDPARVFRLRQGCGERMGVIIMPFLLSAATHLPIKRTLSHVPPHRFLFKARWHDCFW